jgi:hypothetical protein
MPIIKMTMDPAMAKEGKSTPKRARNFSPINKNTTIKAPAAKVALPLSKWFCLFLMLMIMGSEPIISIMANRVNEMVVMS